MSSLHARRPPKLKQGDLRRNRQRTTVGIAAGENTASINFPSQSSIKGGGSLRRPPSATSGIDVSAVNCNDACCSNNTNKKFWNIWRIIKTVVVVALLTYLFMRIKRRRLGSVPSSAVVGLRSNQIHGSRDEISSDEIREPAEG